MSAEKDVVEATRKKTDMSSRSKVLQKIIDSLIKEQFQHMLYWHKKERNEFIVKFVHMNNPEWRKVDYLELFRELDKLSNKYETYLQDKKYDHNCKVRCKSNLLKLVKSEALTFLGKTGKGNSIQLRKYKLNLDVSKVQSAVSKDEKMIKRSNDINLYVSIPVGTDVPSASPVGPLLLDTCCATENRNNSIRNVILQKQTLTGYEYEKQMDKNNVALLTNFTENLNMESEGKFGVQNYIGPVEGAIEDINLASTYYASLGYDELQYSNNLSNEFQNESCQDVDSEVKNLEQLVPYSPQNYEGIINEPLSQFCDDYDADVDKPLQQDNDPLWSENISDCLNELEEYLENNEGSFSFETSEAV